MIGLTFFFGGGASQHPACGRVFGISEPMSNPNCLLSRFGLKTQSPSNTNVPFKIDYGPIEKLLSGDSEPEPAPYSLEEIPDLASILNYKPVLPTPASRY